MKKRPSGFTRTEREALLTRLHRRLYPDRELRPAERATEFRDVEAALAGLPEVEAWVARLLRRMAPTLQLSPGARVLDVGAAQGITVAAYINAGFRGFGVEPWQPALEASREVARRLGVEFELVPGRAESLPFPPESFEFVHAYSVMEHVDDPLACFREAYRVLAPGGGFFFSTTSAHGLRQNEIIGFPLFPLYPSKLQRRIMDWALRERPWLVGNTPRPAYLWFRHRWVRRALGSIGFRVIVDRWELRTDDRTGWQQLAIRSAAGNRGVRFAADLLRGGMQYLAIK
jgi:SAM-dependent methyltransferase